MSALEELVSEGSPRPSEEKAKEVVALEDTVFRLIRDAMRHHRKLFGHSLNTVRSTFEAMDRDKKGRLALPEFKAAMVRLDIGLSDAQLKEVSTRYITPFFHITQHGEYHALGTD